MEKIIGPISFEALRNLLSDRKRVYYEIFCNSLFYENRELDLSEDYSGKIVPIFEFSLYQKGRNLELGSIDIDSMITIEEGYIEYSRRQKKKTVSNNIEDAVNVRLKEHLIPNELVEIIEEENRRVLRLTSRSLQGSYIAEINERLKEKTFDRAKRY